MNRCRHFYRRCESAAVGSGRVFQRSKGAGLFLAGLLLSIFVGSSACQKPDFKPVDIVTGDTCYRCRAPIIEKRYAAEFVSKDGFVRKFDDISCMIEHAKKVGMQNIAAYYVTDYTTQQWMEAEKGYYLKSDQIQTPKEGGILSFKDEAKAESLASQVQAKVMSFDDLVK